MSAPSATAEHRSVAMPEAPRLPGVTFRPFADADVEAVARLMHEANRFDDVPWLPSVEQLRTEFANTTGQEPTRDMLVAEIDGRLVGIAGVARAVRDGKPLYDTWGSVHPSVRRRGLGTALLDWTLRRSAARAEIEDPGVDVSVQGDAEEQETAHIALFASTGFAPVRHYFLMRRPNLDDVPDAPLPDGLEVRPVRLEDRRTILEAEFEAFKDHYGSREPSERSFAMTLENKELDTDLWVVAWDGDQVAGAVENWIWREENEQLGIKRGWLERISVRRPWRRRGLARALTAMSLVRLREAGMDEGMLGVDTQNANGALGLYEGLGFEVYRRATAYRRTLSGRPSGE